ncbi:hypothetical protein OOT46_22875 [Aquabacterium sp. A7-Y]|uniref:hypothetical protein n=1 Tax=Aquabacterium sp. A7-Y TaxID=1349605 RepID=UPI00223DFAE0|nr:hypothetical protein [Aquabacterium sp. A7-Y]MCW7540667.1 hypothetical protein [Aquabacterium sp. A7-Y]
MKVKLGAPPTAWYEFLENCRVAEEDSPDLTVVNLHPSMAFSLEDYHSPQAFPSLDFFDLVDAAMRVPAGTRHLDVSLHFELPETKALWALVKSVMSLHSNGDPAGVLPKQIARYSEKRREYLKEFRCSTTFKCITSFFDDALHPAIGNLRRPLRGLVRDLRAIQGQAVADFENYYRAELESDNFARYSALFDDYFSNFDQFRQLLAYARVGRDDVDELIVGAKRFNDVKLYYGQAYETLTSAYVTLACLNNINHGRSFDTFAAMSLTKYIKDLNKAQKSAPFSAAPVLAAFTKWEDSALRNGSHHAAIARDGERVKYRSGGTGAEREMPYSRYLHMCNGITIACAALMLVELQEFSTIKT